MQFLAEPLPWKADDIRAAEETDAEWIILIAGKGIENSIKRKEGWVPMEPDNKCIERVFCEIESRKG